MAVWNHLQHHCQILVPLLTQVEANLDFSNYQRSDP